MKLLERYEALRERARQEGNTVALSPEFHQTLAAHKALLETARPLRARAATFAPLLERRGGIMAGDLDALAALYQRAARYRRSAVASHARAGGETDAGKAQREREYVLQAQREADARRIILAAEVQAQRQREREPHAGSVNRLGIHIVGTNGLGCPRGSGKV